MTLTYTPPQPDTFASGDPQPHDLTRVYDELGGEWDIEPFAGLWVHIEPCCGQTIRLSWHHLTEVRGPLSRYRATVGAS